MEILKKITKDGKEEDLYPEDNEEEENNVEFE
jgi:hypothetical protein